MHFSVGTLVALAAGFSAVQAHMIMESPTPYGKSTINNGPLSGDGSDYPCKQRNGVYETEGAENIMPLGSTQTLSFKGSAVHGGGSCQISITYDKKPTKDSTFKVIHSIIGGCPAKNVNGNLPSNPSGNGADKYTFQMPNDLPLGEATLAWTWFNKIGVREMYMNCAPITITAAGGAQGGSQAAFSALPDMFKANIGNGCKTVDNRDADFPNPGKFFSKFGSTPPERPVGTCQAGSGSSGASGNTNGDSVSPAASSSATSPASPAASSPAQPSESSSVSAQATATRPYGYGTALPSNPGGRFITQSAAPTAATTSPSPGAAQPTGSSGSGTGSGNTHNANGGFTSGSSQTGACTPEGAFVCLPGGKSFQQCGSGRWSPIMPMAPGTSCAPPQAAGPAANASNNSSGGDGSGKYKSKAKRHLRFGHVHLRRHHGLSLA